jgi:hypothetical protein
VEVLPRRHRAMASWIRCALRMPRRSVPHPATHAGQCAQVHAQHARRARSSGGRQQTGNGPEARRECPRSGKTCAGDSQPGTCVRPGSSSQTDACQRQGGRQRPAIQTACAPEEDLRYYRSQDAKDDEGRGQEAHHRSREHHDIVDRPADKRPAHCAGVLLFRVPSNRI